MPLHPQAKAFIEQLAAQNAPGWHELPPVESREIFASLTEIFGAGPEIHNVEDREIAAGVRVRIYRTSEDANRPVVIYFHGGGWVLGNLETHDSLCRHLAKESDFVVISVDYRLAPENRYPAAFDDAFAATKYVSEHAEEFGIAPEQLFVAGDSAGGNLAAAVAIKARDVDGPPIRAQILIYPVIEPNFETESYQRFATDHGLTRETMQWFWEQYVAIPAAGQSYVALAGSDLNGLAPAHVITAEYDVLRDEGENYAALLQAANVPTTTRRYEGMLHGFIHFGGIFDDGITAMRDIAAVLKKYVDGSS